MPTEVVVTNARPDLVLMDTEAKTIELYELTSCADKAENIRKARERKIHRYSRLVLDMEAAGWKASITPIQVCALGNIDTESRKTFAKLLGKRSSRKTCKKLARIAIGASYVIFNRRREPEWHAPGYLEMSVD